ncbi:hypothetical protein GTO89_03910 [Heliobacterium gestii]|uniref:Uncharacterized protein n=1 Tax=Heliomicrobium gestii TaxID=2699 RepID=A0A845LF88_HELGE|nr:hypothetical protein [Heliomicrobium gestii]MBM7866753.1 putative paraquat-inducible protein A [Heliomicrobium gestii]MZP42183.1 hypothetical protein [Heliomicrobium gestii]
MGWFSSKKKTDSACAAGPYISACPGCGLDVRVWQQGQGEGKEPRERCPRCNTLLRPAMGCGGCGGCGSCSK